MTVMHTVIAFVNRRKNSRRFFARLSSITCGKFTVGEMDINSKSNDVEMGLLCYADRCIYGKEIQPNSCKGRALASGPPYYGKCKACYQKSVDLQSQRNKGI